MALKIFHTADLHLGMKFPKYPHFQNDLFNARFITLNNMVNTANKEKVDLFVISGDLFQNKTPLEREIEKVTDAINNFEGKLILILPGNHDYCSEDLDNLWENFQEKSEDNLIILNKKRIISLENYGFDANVYPAPCHSRHSNENSVGWIKGSKIDNNVKYHIGIAHGSLEGFSPDYKKNYYPMKIRELNSLGLDIWLLGHTHTQYPANHEITNNIFISGSPEPAYGKFWPNEGKAWIISLDNSKRVKADSIKTGKFRILEESIKLNPTITTKDILSRFSNEEYSSILLKLKLTGTLTIEEFKKLRGLQDKLEDIVGILSLDYSAVTEEITKNHIDSNFTEKFFPHTLLTLLQSEDSPHALQIAWELIQEAKE